MNNLDEKDQEQTDKSIYEYDERSFHDTEIKISENED